MTLWLGDEAEAVPRAVLNCVVTVPVGDSGPGSMRQEGPAQATVGNMSCSQDEMVFVVEAEAKDFNESQTDVASRVAKPRLWRYGDAANLFERDEALSTAEWSACILLREDCWSN